MRRAVGKKKSPHSVQGYETAHKAAQLFTHSQVEAALKEREDEWHWAKQPSGSISLPDFIQLRAKGKAEIINGHVYLKKPGPDPELQALMAKRMNDAYKAMEEAMTKTLYGDKE